jgi:hypothetical protein
MPDEAAEQKKKKMTLVDAIRTAYRRHKHEIENVKEEARKTGEDPEWIWEGLVRSAATWGSIRGIKVQRVPELHELVRWGALERLDKKGREKQLRAALNEAAVRWADKKVPYLLANFCLVKSMGGPQKVQEDLDSLLTSEGIVDFLRKKFRGVGPKYARNIMMDGYHPKFRSSIAIDARIQKILKKAGRPFGGNKDYGDAEQFLLAVAKEVRIEGWVLDRLLFLYNGEILDCI